MLLQKLADHAESLDLAPSMYAATPVRWLVHLDSSGSSHFVSLQGEGRAGQRGERLLAPHVQRSSGVRAKLLADTAEYVLGIARDPAKQERVDRCHEAFVELVERCAEETGEPTVAAVARFVRAFDRTTFEPPDGFEAGDTLTFRVGETLPIDLPSVRRWWAAATGGDEDEESAVLQCLVCGEVKPVEKRLPFKIKGIPGGQSAGTALVSANAGAFESYGLEASLISPICRDCGERFAKVANRLLRDEATHLVIGPLAYLFWVEGPSEIPFADFFRDPDPREVEALLTAAWRGAPEATELEAEPFYAAALAASGGRVAVRDWIVSTVPRVKENLARWFERQRLADPYHPGEPRPFKLFALAASTVRDPRDLRSETSRALLAHALDRKPLPLRLLYEAVQRNRAEQGITRPRAALVKLVLLSHDEPEKEDFMVKLEPDHPEPAYHCGRLLAVLEEVQRRALGNPSATLVDRFFGSASAAPASVFGTLLRNAQPHLGKLRKDKHGAFQGFQRQLEGVLSRLDSFPTTLDMKRQALFSLGYYHQRAHDHAARAEATAAKQTGAAEPTA